MGSECDLRYSPRSDLLTASLLHVISYLCPIWRHFVDLTLGVRVYFLVIGVV